MASKEEMNLKKLAKSSVLMNFVKRSDGRWNHEQWLGLLDDLAKKGYKPIDSNQIGLMLEEKKEIYLAKK